MAHWRDGGIGNMAGSDDRPIEEWTLLEKLAEIASTPVGSLSAPRCLNIGAGCDWATPLSKIAKDAFYEIDHLREAVSLATGALARVPQWQLIDTAPKDGTIIDIIDANASEPQPFTAHWAQSNGWGSDPAWLVGTPEMWAAGRSKWRKTRADERNAAACLGVIESPTHWMPRPPAPKVES